jgi:hypothetical protein
MSNEIAKHKQQSAEQEISAEVRIRILSDAAENGDSEAQYQLGLIYYSGTAVSSDHQRAWNWFKLADAKDHKMASYYHPTIWGGYVQSRGSMRSRWTGFIGVVNWDFILRSRVSVCVI